MVVESILWCDGTLSSDTRQAMAHVLFGLLTMTNRLGKIRGNEGEGKE